jgi:hypothetical protein
VKSDGDFEDILGEDTPAIWQSHRPAKGGDAGAMLATIIDRAAKLKTSRSALTDDTKGIKETKGRKVSKTQKAQGAKNKKKK